MWGDAPTGSGGRRPRLQHAVKGNACEHDCTDVGSRVTPGAVTELPSYREEPQREGLAFTFGSGKRQMSCMDPFGRYYEKMGYRNQ